MVRIGGGGYIAGSGTGRTTDGSNLARQGVVLVTLNYRLGPFGFLAHPLLTKESPHHASGNYGLMDQVAALEWVHKNIAGFGGDPSNVTIFGESAGAGSVCRLLVTPLSDGLFQRAIAESGSGRTAITLAQAEKAGERFGNDLAAMRAKSTTQIMTEAGFKSDFFFGDGMTYDMIVDGWVLPEEAQRMFLSGRRHNVPFLTGTNADEGTGFHHASTRQNRRSVSRLHAHALPPGRPQTAGIVPRGEGRRCARCDGAHPGRFQFPDH